MIRPLKQEENFQGSEDLSMNLVFLGAPGSGKGTQALFLLEENQLSFKHISTGDILRAEVKRESDLGKKIRDVIDAGGLLQDDLMEEILLNNLDVEKHNYIFDGYPRTLIQAERFSKYILKNNPFRVIYFDVDEKILTSRLVGRRVCSACNEIYHVDFKPPKKEGTCSVCKGKLVHRDDDNFDIVNKE